VRKPTDLFDNNARWARGLSEHDPQFFERLSAQQSPKYLWIGCSDSRVPANDIVGLLPGELFVHRNVANIVGHTDLNCLSVLQYAIDVLRVEHVIVCGHYGCGGVRAALSSATLGLIDNWLRDVQDVAERQAALMASARDGDDAVDLLCELNVVAQTRHVCETTVMQDAWRRGQAVAVHGWIYGLNDGRVRDLDCSAEAPSDVARSQAQALERIAARRK